MFYVFIYITSLMFGESSLGPIFPILTTVHAAFEEETGSIFVCKIAPWDIIIFRAKDQIKKIGIWIYSFAFLGLYSVWGKRKSDF